jgi:hypothetical protein
VFRRFHFFRPSHGDGVGSTRVELSELLVAFQRDRRRSAIAGHNEGTARRKSGEQGDFGIELRAKKTRLIGGLELFDATLEIIAQVCTLSRTRQKIVQK